MSTGLPPGEQEQNSHKIIGGAPLELENSYREVDRLTASSVMHASRVRSPLILLGYFKYHCFFLSQRD